MHPRPAGQGVPGLEADRTKRRAIGAAGVLACASLAIAGHADARESFELAAAGDFARLSIEELGDIEITSVSRRPEPVGQAPSAAYVITNDDIRRSGYLTLPETLRLAPNLHVARIDALDYSISSRGFAGFESANKLLVLIDGRSVYTPLFGGVDWDQQHVLLDDVDRIEVISGPGGALWGANAVNGVINVATRSSVDTQGLLVAGAAGTLDSDVRARYGGRIGQAGAYRVYATGYQRGDLNVVRGRSADDGWDGYQVGFRTDWAAGSDRLTLQGDLHDNSIDKSAGLEGYVRGGNVLGRWTREFAGAGRLEVQAYYDEVEREARLVYDGLKTYDIDIQHAFSFGGGGHRIVWGGGYRVTHDEFLPLTTPQLLDPGSRKVTIANLFIQDEMALRPDLSLTVGLKLEENSYTRLEPMPSVRLAWRPSQGRLVWAVVSRAVRNPSRIERDFFVAGLVEPGYFDAEKLLSYEAGYRTEVFGRASLSLSIFYNDYDDLRTNDFSAPPNVLPLRVGNSMEGRTYGAEAWGAFDVADWWRLSGGFTWFGKDFRLKPGSLDISGFEAAGVDPDAWANLRSQFRLTPDLDLDLSGRAVDDVPPARAAGYVGADGYVEMDARLAWRARPNVELALAAFNLLHRQHAEASEDRRRLAPRSLYAGVRWTY